MQLDLTSSLVLNVHREEAWAHDPPLSLETFAEKV